MKLFISWSGEFSRKVAECLSIWIPTIIQAVDVFYSPDDIAKGENWGNRLSEELEQSNFGIVCLTPENVLAPWIHFEAGALSKASNSRVSAIMLGINPSDIKGPLARLQNTSFDRDDFHRLFQSINECSEKPLRADILDNAFNNSWENLAGDITPIIKNYTSRSSLGKDKPERLENDALQEILRLVRSLDNRRNISSSYFSSSDPGFLNVAIENATVHLRGSKEQFICAAPIIFNYSRVPIEIKFDELPEGPHEQDILVHPDRLPNFIRAIHGVAPEMQIL